jgi:hypothetical protein
MMVVVFTLVTSSISKATNPIFVSSYASANSTHAFGGPNSITHSWPGDRSGYGISAENSDNNGGRASAVSSGTNLHAESHTVPYNPGIIGYFPFDSAQANVYFTTGVPVSELHFLIAYKTSDVGSRGEIDIDNNVVTLPFTQNNTPGTYIDQGSYLYVGAMGQHAIGVSVQSGTSTSNRDVSASIIWGIDSLPGEYAYDPIKSNEPVDVAGYQIRLSPNDLSQSNELISPVASALITPVSDLPSIGWRSGGCQCCNCQLAGCFTWRVALVGRRLASLVRFSLEGE